MGRPLDGRPPASQPRACSGARGAAREHSHPRARRPRDLLLPRAGAAGARGPAPHKATVRWLQRTPVEAAHGPKCSRFGFNAFRPPHRGAGVVLGAGPAATCPLEHHAGRPEQRVRLQRLQEAPADHVRGLHAEALRRPGSSARRLTGAAQRQDSVERGRRLAVHRQDEVTLDGVCLARRAQHRLGDVHAGRDGPELAHAPRRLLEQQAVPADYPPRPVAPQELHRRLHGVLLAAP
mmetsp:Transcript_22582/g.58898  ORF Transcript_22582/g.58898 Transcript_22582/m.58898 type:complete len:236 (+) Transcript_22582:112-819(+)